MYIWDSDHMAYVRYKLPDETHKILKKVCEKLGLKESELSRIALMEYLKSLGVLSDRVKRTKIKFHIGK